MNSKIKSVPFSIAPFLAAASVAAVPSVMAAPSDAGAALHEAAAYNTAGETRNARNYGVRQRPQASLAPATGTVTTARPKAARRGNSYFLRVTSPLETPATKLLPAAGAPTIASQATVYAPVAVEARPSAPAATPAGAPKSYATQREKQRAGVRVAAAPALSVPLETKAPAPLIRTTPAVLSSRHRDSQLLAQLEADLQRSERNLSRADADLSEGQRQLVSFGNELSRAMLEAGPDARGLHPFVKVAQRYAGTPYVWGGESRSGFDCSGFIIIVMRDLGYKALPHSAAEQFRYGLPVAQQLLKPGDLVFFANTYKPGISHVGIYLGKRRFIHAAGTGQGTIVSSLDAPKFQAKYAGARRLVAAGRGR